MVSDDGPGVKSEIRERVFDPFFTTREKGAGLGLSISHKIASSHGGSLVLEDPDELGGALFVLTLPVSDQLSKNSL